MSDAALAKGKITDGDLRLLEKRIGTPNPTLRAGLPLEPWNPVVDANGVRRWAASIGDDNPLYRDASHARRSVWGAPVAPPGFEWSMGWERSPSVSAELVAETRWALRGVQLYHSGAEYHYYRPLTEGTELYKSEWLAGAAEKESRFANRTVITTNANAFWDQDEVVRITSSRWFVHAERRQLSDEDKAKAKAEAEAKDAKTSGGYQPPHYTDEQLAEIDAAYENQFLRGAETLYFEDVRPDMAMPTMVKGPLTITDMINMHMGAGWITYASPAYRMAYQNRKRLKGFYVRNQFNAWDTLQRVHWDEDLARSVGVPAIYDIGPMRFVMLCHYLTNWAGDDAFVHRIRYELRSFNYLGDVTWLSGKIVEIRIDEKLGPLVELEVSGINQRGEKNITGAATVLLPSRAGGPVRLPDPPPMPKYRSDKPTAPGL